MDETMRPTEIMKCANARVATDSSQDFSKDSGWGLIRLGVLVAFPLFWMAADYLFYHFIQQQYQMLDFGNMPASGYRYFWFPVIILGLALLTGARYIQHAYDLSSVSVAFNYLSSALFTVRLLRITVTTVKVLKKMRNWHIIGGPALSMCSRPGVVENLAGSVRVGYSALIIFPAGNDQRNITWKTVCQGDKIVATSRDGTMVACDIQYRTPAATIGSRGCGRTTSDPYPFSEVLSKP
jgi:hypothetical protein